MEKIDTAFGTLSVREDFEEVAFEVIRKAHNLGWQDVDFEAVDKYIYNGVGELTEYLFTKRDEAIIWLNQNCVTDKVYFEYFETLDEDYEDNETLVAGFGIYSTEFKEKYKEN